MWVILAAKVAAVSYTHLDVYKRQGVERLQAGYVSSLEFAPRPRWPLAEMKAENK